MLEGSVQRIGNNVRIVVQLISAVKDEHIWATNYDRDISDIFVVQSEIAKTIAENLKVILTSNERKIIENAPTDNLVAYDLYLKAVHQKKVQDITGRDKSDVDNLIEMFAQVIRMDENFGLAYGMLGEQLAKLNRWGVPKSIWVDSAMHMLDKALQLDPTNANVYRYKANIYHLLHYNKPIATHSIGTEPSTCIKVILYGLFLSKSG